MGSGGSWWAYPPPGRIAFLAGVDPALLSVALDPLPAEAPAIVRFRPTGGELVGHYVATFLDALDQAAVELFPRWLPGAEQFDGGTALGIAAVRTRAAIMAAGSAHFGPFLISTAERAARVRSGEHADRRARFPAEVRARGLGAILAAAYGRPAVAVLIDVPAGLPPAGEQALVAAAEWLAEQGRFTVWLAGPEPRSVDRVPRVRPVLPGYLAGLAEDAAALPEPAADPPVLSYPPLSGLPRADSPAEQALERALARQDWARGRRWNSVLEAHLLGRAYRLDVYWPADGLVVEVDGDDHRERGKYADDRRRDAQLQLLGYDVLRFTNDQVLADPLAVSLTIRQLLLLRRAGSAHPTPK